MSGDRRFEATRPHLSARLGLVGALTALFMAPLIVAPPVAVAATVNATLVRTVALSDLVPPSPDPSGIAWDQGAGRFIISDSEVEEMTIFQNANVYELNVQGQLTGFGDITPPAPGFSNEPTGLTLDPASGHLFVSDDNLQRIFRLAPGTDGDFGTPDDSIVGSFKTDDFGNNDPEDVAFDTGTGDLYTVDGNGREVYRIRPGGDGVFNGVPPAGDDVVSSFDTGQFGSSSTEGLGYDATRNTLLVVDPTKKKIYETTKSGTLLNTIDLSLANPRHAEDVVLAPSLADPGQMNMYVVARGVDNNADPNENDGKMHELSVTLPPVGNEAPQVDAGPDRETTLPNGVTLAGSVTDDGLPQGAQLTATWSQVSGPGTATFIDPSSPTTDVTFSAPGTYVLRLTGDDTELQASDEMTVAVNPEGTTVLDIPIVAGADDAEEAASGSVARGNAKLELAYKGGSQTVGLRFRSVSIPAGATIQQAYVQFAVAQATSTAVNLSVEGQAADDPGPFQATPFDISSRPRTAADVPWAPPEWTVVNQQGAAQRTPNLATVIQEIADRPGWNAGNDLVLILTGDGAPTFRAAWAYNGVGPEPVLHVELAPPA